MDLDRGILEDNLCESLGLNHLMAWKEIEYSLHIPVKGGRTQYSKDGENKVGISKEDLSGHTNFGLEIAKHKKEWLMKGISQDIGNKVENGEDLRERISNANNEEAIKDVIAEFEVAKWLLDTGWELSYEPDLSESLEEDDPKPPEFEARKGEKILYVEVKRVRRQEADRDGDLVYNDLERRIESIEEPLSIFLKLEEYDIHIAKDIVRAIEGKISENNPMPEEEWFDIEVAGQNVGEFKVLGENESGICQVAMREYPIQEIEGVTLRNQVKEANKKDIPEGLPFLTVVKMDRITSDVEVDVAFQGDYEVTLFHDEGEVKAIKQEQSGGLFDEDAERISTVSSVLCYGGTSEEYIYHENPNAQIEITEDLMESLEI